MGRWAWRGGGAAWRLARLVAIGRDRRRVGSGWADVENLAVKLATGWCRAFRRHTRSWQRRASSSEAPDPSHDPLIHPNPSQPHPRARKTRATQRSDVVVPSPATAFSKGRPRQAEHDTRTRNMEKRVTYRLKSLCPLVPASLTTRPLAAVAGLAAGDVGVIRGVLLGHREVFSLPSTGGSGKKK